jgi:hypothetical protein
MPNFVAHPERHTPIIHPTDCASFIADSAERQQELTHG